MTPVNWLVVHAKAPLKFFLVVEASALMYCHEVVTRPHEESRGWTRSGSPHPDVTERSRVELPDRSNSPCLSQIVSWIENAELDEREEF